ncbi:MAG: bacterial proteasome activator family protein [Actinomycetota bacterium]|nr:bacterial proteasome activator family protein [Actinomycetota bacterium]
MKAPQPGQQPEEAPRDAVEHPGKLLRIAAMIRELLEEVRQGRMDEAARVRLREMYERAVGELKEILSPDLAEELGALGIPLQEATTESELRVGQAQLVGWLEGLFHGMQAAMWAQHMAARAQFEEMRRRGLPMGPPREQQDTPRAGQYL